ncbi:hypothetical protein COO09_03150 [Rhizorhabdus dicambivorans]|uniref:Uncharacterized protein n=1 Tax=Rhizorhabdus dicambivorans TaxID=1850238 RepID=A0A2A4FYR9_9SPHN|nr:hypothetical protein CMV14_21000 [Rhizorhabdus dicambivorans]PCE43934.1 hypothetical protein COO09_03150 [Rhizorhabdus dicambivorans]
MRTRQGLVILTTQEGRFRFLRRVDSWIAIPAQPGPLRKERPLPTRVILADAGIHKPSAKRLELQRIWIPAFGI